MSSNSMDIASYDKYTMPEEEEKKLWQDCFFIFDSSALLNFYNYPESSRQEIYSGIFEKKAVKDKLWMASHVQFEYLKNREACIKKLLSNYEIPINTLKQIQSSLKEIN